MKSMLKINDQKLKPRLKPEIVREGFFFEPSRTIQWVGGVNYANYADAVGQIADLLKDDSAKAINLVVTSPGGQTGISMSFYDTMKSVYRPKLVTIGSGDVDSSGIIIFLSGKKRFITAHTTMLLHLGGRTLEGSRRFSSDDMGYMVREDNIKDFHYASLISEESGKLTPDQVMTMMRNNTVLTAEEAKKLGLTHYII